MDLVLRKIGNSTGLTFPPAFLRAHDLSEGQTLTVEARRDGSIRLRPKAVPKRYTAAELNAQCDFKAPMPASLDEWDRAPRQGSEAL